jgi:hypothetical protein
LSGRNDSVDGGEEILRREGFIEADNGDGHFIGSHKRAPMIVEDVRLAFAVELLGGSSGVNAFERRFRLLPQFWGFYGGWSVPVIVYFIVVLFVAGISVFMTGVGGWTRGKNSGLDE